MAWFTFTDASGEVFVFKLADADAIAHARALLDGAVTFDPRIAGEVVKAPAAYNIGWSFHIDPASMFFFELSAEVGDSTMRYIEEHLSEVGGALLPGSVWTGWSSVLLEELTAKSGSSGCDVLFGAATSDILFGRGGNDLLRGGRGGDHLVSGSGDDRAFGGFGDDKLGGVGGDDFLWGGGGADILVGGAGRDSLGGGVGRDTFVFTPGDRRDEILDFTDCGREADDLIDLRAFDFARKSEIGRIAFGPHLILDLGGGDAIIIRDYLSAHEGGEINDNILI